MTLVSPSDTGLFYFPDFVREGEFVSATGADELNHLTNVMRKKSGDKIYITDGKGTLIFGVITQLSRKELTLSVLSSEQQNNRFERFTVLLPILKNPDRFEFAFEKSVELGFTRFKAVKFQHSVKFAVNLDRLNLKAIAAMKQSLRSHLPRIEYSDSLNSALTQGGIPLYFNQNAPSDLSEDFRDSGASYLLVIGPEGGFSSFEIEILKTGVSYRLSRGRLRAETAVITAASLLANKIDFQ